ncbi:MAG: hydantoin utilization protein, partial [Bdellovibrio sp.]|nr:hydantoin utilization protein [Bdellovibrio sp.]
FEHWLDLRGCSGNALTSEEMHFSVRERIQADGSVTTPIAMEELEAIAAKLQMMETKKVCLHFLHANINPAHENAAKTYFIEKGFEIFTPEKSDNQDEITRWRRNALNATISGLFSEIKKDILEGLQEALDAKEIFFLNSEGHTFQDEAQQRVSSLFASYSALGLQYQDAGCDVLHLGLEDFVLISPKSWTDTWQSPWGIVENRQLKMTFLNVQPTLGLALNDFKHFDFNNNCEGWEPGPMSLGRGQKPTLIDLWAENPKLEKVEGLQDRQIAAGVQKFKNALLVMLKASSNRDKETPALIKDMQSLALQKVVMESLLMRAQKKVKVTGALAEVFANGFKKDAGANIDTEDFAEARAVVAVGKKALKV